MEKETPRPGGFPEHKIGLVKEPNEDTPQKKAEKPKAEKPAAKKEAE